MATGMSYGGMESDIMEGDVIDFTFVQRTPDPSTQVPSQSSHFSLNGRDYWRTLLTAQLRQLLVTHIHRISQIVIVYRDDDAVSGAARNPTIYIRFGSTRDSLPVVSVRGPRQDASVQSLDEYRRANAIDPLTGRPQVTHRAADGWEVPAWVLAESRNRFGSDYY